MKKRSFVSFLITVLFLFNSCCVSAAFAGGQEITSKGAFVMDYATGEELYSYQGDTLRAPASMTKVMTLYVVLEAIHNGEISYDTTVNISEATYEIGHDPENQTAKLRYGVNYRIDDLMDVTLVYSACDASHALAEAVSGTEKAFVDRMNNTAKRMGINAVFADSSGLEASYVTPRAMATIVRNVISDYPEILDISKKKSIYFDGTEYKNTNKLLGSLYYDGADGMKTGTTSLAGCCFTGTAQRNGERIIAVTMGSDGGNHRFDDVKTMLDFGFAKLAERKYIYTTDFKAYINNVRIPCFYTQSGGGKPLIIAEDLKDYGYDINYIDSEKTLYLTYNPNKTYTPIPMDYYNSLSPMKAFMKYYEPSVIRVLIQNGNIITEADDVFRLDGYMAIPIEALNPLSSEFDYNTDLKTISISY